MKRLDKETFIKKSKEIHNNKFDYSLVEYKNVRTLVKIICPNCGIFEQLPWTHMKGIGCSKCQNLTNEKFIEKSNVKHNNKYEYSLVEVINNKVKVDIICKIHGIFKQRPDSHMRGSGCPICHVENISLRKEKFIKKSNDIHNKTYNYEIVNYIDNKHKVNIICKKHGIFEQRVGQHLSGSGCPICSSSRGEKKIIKLLNKRNIEFERQKKFNECKNKRELIFDFYLPKYNLCIEFNGKQHYESVEHFGGNKSLEYTKKNDSIKKSFCENNNIKLLVISYKEKIEDVLIKFFN